MLILICTVLMGAFLMTALLRKYALAKSLIDVPNSRSSHTIPTPRGGGVAIVVCFLLSLVWMLFADVLDRSWALGLIGAGTGTAILGFLDDHGHIAARWRLLGHFAAATWLLIWTGGLPPLQAFGSTFDLGWLGHALAALYLVWMLNLYNFMDGIDGIASVEGICVCLGGGLLYWVSGENQLIGVPLALAAAIAGFLVWNFPPAKIFMGDAGSGFLGLILGGLSIQAAYVSPPLFWSWLILLGVFVVDATFTLVRRLIRGDKVYEAHRSHAYQYASRQFGRHLPVTLAVLVVNLIWLLPISLVVGFGWLDGLLGVLIAYLPLLVLAIRFHAGRLEIESS
ncbi:putative undecaprenyl-phosphate N-acetylglucosaminyl 1-phosphate transferase [compost metagenome]